MHMIANLPPFHGFLAFGMPNGQELLFILLIVLVLFGAKRLPELARGLGQSVNEFKKAKDEFDKEVAKPSSTASTASTDSPATGTAASKDDQKPS